MPRLVKSLPKYRKHRASGQAVVPPHGTDHYHGPYNSKSSKQLYDRLIAEYCTGKRTPVAGDSISVLEVIHRYRQFYKVYYVKDGKATSAQGAICWVAKSLKQFYGSLPATGFGPQPLAITPPMSPVDARLIQALPIATEGRYPDVECIISNLSNATNRVYFDQQDLGAFRTL